MNLWLEVSMFGVVQAASCGRGDAPVDLVLLWRFELGGGLMSRVADAKDLFIAV